MSYRAEIKHNKDPFSNLGIDKFKKWTPSQKADYFLSIIALSQIFFALVQFLLIAFEMSQEESTRYRILMSAIAIIASLPFLLRRNLKLCCIVYFFVSLVYAFHMLVFPETIPYWRNEGLKFLIPISIPIVLCMVSIKNINFFVLALKHISYACALLGILFGIRTLTGRFVLSEYSMGFGYCILLPMLVLFYQRKFYSIIISLLLFMLLVVYGSRGPLLTVAIFLLYMLIDKKSYGLVGVIVAVGIAGFTAFVSYIESLGISSRTVSMFLGGNLDAESNRDAIVQKAIDLINANPITGCGLFGDRKPIGDWCHNIILEFFCDFGVFLGSVLLILFFYWILMSFIKLKGMNKDILAMFIAYALVPMFVSNSYLTDSNFALFTGLLFLILKLSPWKKHSISNKKASISTI